MDDPTYLEDLAEYKAKNKPAYLADITPFCQKGAVIENVPVKFYPKKDEYYQMATIMDTGEPFPACVKPGWMAFDDAWVFIAKTHPKFKEINWGDIWRCKLVYFGYGWSDNDGRYYHVEVFLAHPVERIYRGDKW